MRFGNCTASTQARFASMREAPGYLPIVIASGPLSFEWPATSAKVHAVKRHGLHATSKAGSFANSRINAAADASP